MSSPQILGIGIACVYASDFQESFGFYHELLELNDVNTMSESSCYFKINDKQGLYLVGGHDATEYIENNTRTTFALTVQSIDETFALLHRAGAELIHQEPMQMNDKDYWFQCCDPSGNVIEFIGQK